MQTIELIDELLAKERHEQEMERLLDPTKVPAFWPSEAGAEIDLGDGITQRVGGCRRKTFYRWNKIPMTNPPPPKSIRKFEHGDAMEQVELERMKRAGILMSETDPKRKPKGANLKRKIRWELDGIMLDGELGIGGLEVKSFYGYYASKEILGNSKQPGFPRENNLIQVMLYLDLTQLPYFKIMYFARDSIDKAEYIITMTPTGHVRVVNEITGIDTVFKPFPVYEIYKGYEDLYENFITKGQVPDCDYRKVYPEEEIELRWKKGLLSKTKYNNWKKNPDKYFIGDWQCSSLYCSYYDLCRGKVKIEDIQCPDGTKATITPMQSE